MMVDEKKKKERSGNKMLGMMNDEVTDYKERKEYHHSNKTRVYEIKQIIRFDILVMLKNTM